MSSVQRQKDGRRSGAKPAANPPSGQISGLADALIERRRKWLLDNGDAAESADPYVRGYFNGVIEGLNSAIAIVGERVMNYRRIIQSPYGGDPDNFDVSRLGSELHVTLTYPPRTDADNPEQARHVVINQESVRASDGVRLHYDYERDGFVVEQNRVTLRKTGSNSYASVDNWTEVGFFASWAFGGPELTAKDYAKADAEYQP